MQSRGYRQGTSAIELICVGWQWKTIDEKDSPEKKPVVKKKKKQDQTLDAEYSAQVHTIYPIRFSHLTEVVEY